MTRPILVGIAGGSGSGKTTVAEKIMHETAQPVVFLKQDSYYRNFDGLTIEQKRGINYDHPSAYDDDLLIEHLQCLTRGEAVDVGDLPEGLRGAGAAAPAAGPASLTVPLGTTMDEVERLVIRETLRQTRGDKTLAAQLLGIAARTIYRKLDRDEAGRLRGPGEGAPEEPDPA